MLSNFFFTAILISSLIFTTCSYNSHLLCLDHQKSLLLQLKFELIFDPSISTKLVQWNQTHDCCKWYGVDCDGAGYVISLQLDDESISGGIGVSSSLFKLKYLEKLNLADNDFGYTPIPRDILNLTYLTHLNLSNAFLGVPLEVSSLTRLVSLDFSDNYAISLNLEMLVRNLTRLSELYLDGVNITSAHERRKWSHIISSYLPNITTLSLSNCFLSGPLAESFWQLHSLSTLRLDWNDLSTPVSPFFVSFSSLTTLSLVNCSLKGSFPDMIFHIPTLQYLDLSQNELLSGILPPFTLNGSLQSVTLHKTNFSGSIQNSVGNLKNLSYLDLSDCKFTGAVPSTFANLTQLTHVDLSRNLFAGSLSPTLFQGLTNLVYVDLSRNLFSGSIPHSLFALPSLLNLYLRYNNFTGKVEELSVPINVTELFELDLSHNQLEGPIPHFFFQLHSLDSLSLSDNLFSGTFQLEKIRRLANLTHLNLSRNNLRVGVRNDNSTSYGLPQLQLLRLASCNLNDFPDFIKHFGMIEWLDLANNGIGGEIPTWIWGLTQLWELDLSHNHLSGELNLLIPPNITSHLWSLLLSNNSLSGSIPTSLCTATNLYALDLSDNKLSGTIPSCLHAMSNLYAVDLGRNNLSGPIPDIFSTNCMLRYFDLNNNTLHGKLPTSLKNCEQLTYMNVGNNIISDTFPCMLPSSLRVLVLHSNSFHGEVTSCHNSSWPDLQILDISSNHFGGSLEKINFSSWKGMVQGNGNYNLENSRMTLIMKGLPVDLYKIWSDFSSVDFSCNNFEGEIPNVIGDLSLLHHLNLSNNALNGSIPNSFGKLRNLESLDLSRNQLIGAIPMELGGLTFLSHLNLSYNKLVGKIPNGRQLQTFTADSFKGNRLCGFPLNINCSPSISDSDLSHEKVEEKKEIEWEYVSAALGYVVGLGSIVWLLLFCRSFRKKYFDKIDDVVEEIFDARDMRRKGRAIARRRALRNEAVMRRRH